MLRMKNFNILVFIDFGGVQSRRTNIERGCLKRRAWTVSQFQGGQLARDTQIWGWCPANNGYPGDIEILGWCPAGPVLPHGEKMPL